MGDVYFYHLMQTPLFDTVFMVCTKARAAGWVVLVRGKVQETINNLDQRMWTRDGFFPHGVEFEAEGQFDAVQPVLLTLQPEGSALSNNPDCLVLIDGADVNDAESAQLKRVCVVFDGRDNNAVEHARTQWTHWRAAGAQVHYWMHEHGKWVEKQMG